MPLEQLKLTNQLCHRLYKASNSIARAYREPLSELDLTYPQYVVMMALWEHDDISIAYLIEKTAIDGSALTQILKKMTDKNVLTVIKDPQDGRKRTLKLTDKGRELSQQAANIPGTIRCKFNSMSDVQLNQLMQLLDVLDADLN